MGELGNDLICGSFPHRVATMEGMFMCKQRCPAWPCDFCCRTGLIMGVSKQGNDVCGATRMTIRCRTDRKHRHCTGRAERPRTNVHWQPDANHPPLPFPCPFLLSVPDIADLVEQERRISSVFEGSMRSSLILLSVLSGKA